jgi:hypothetical protein
MTAARATLVGGALLAAACVERLSAPGQCPAFCPAGQITVVDTLLAANIARDSAFRGYVDAPGDSVMLAADLGFVDSRPIFRFRGVGPRLAIRTNDTTTGAVLRADSARLKLFVTRRETAAHNLTLRLYRLPRTIDTTTSFASLAGPFADSLVRTVNLDTLLARPGKKDSVTGDSAVVDTVNHRVVVWLKLDTAAVRYVAADTGQVAYGLRVSADSVASIALGKGTIGPELQWYLAVDSLGTPVKRAPTVTAGFASFVFDPPPPALDSTLAVGGVPAARSVLRVSLPREIRDSAHIIRATLVLVPAVAARGAPADSFQVEAHTVLADFGAKSPLAIDVKRADTARIRIGATDTVAIEVTNLLQAWAVDTTRPTTIVLRAQPEGGSFAEIRFYPSRAAAYRPALRVTFLPRFPFGAP